jgi:hypothetical protein
MSSHWNKATSILLQWPRGTLPQWPKLLLGDEGPPFGCGWPPFGCGLLLQLIAIEPCPPFFLIVKG